MDKFDLIVIGSGPAGYTGAIRAAQLGYKVACVDKNPNLGGTCLNEGCIPSKSLLDFSKKYKESISNFADIGIEAKGISLNLNQMMSKKAEVVGGLNQGIDMLFKKNKITKFVGNAQIIDEENNIVEVKVDKGSNGKSIKISASKILIATGSKINKIPSVDIDEKSIISSTGALELKQVPKKMVVIGGGYIGLELGLVWKRLGSDVTIVEFADKIVPMIDVEIGKKLQQSLEKQGIKFMLSTKLLKAEKSKKSVLIELENIGSSKKEKMEADVVLISVGRKPNTDGLFVDESNIITDEYGYIKVNNQFETTSKNIYAVGDVVPGPSLAHKAEEEAVAAVEMMHSQKPHVNYDLIPSVIYTYPEVAYVGKTEEELKNNNIKYKVGKFPFLANSMAKATLSTEGMVKILADAKTDRILGAHIIGREAGTMIAEIVAYMEFGASSEDIVRTTHAHPTLNEAIKEAAMNIEKRAINM